MFDNDLITAVSRGWHRVENLCGAARGVYKMELPVFHSFYWLFCNCAAFAYSNVLWLLFGVTKCLVIVAFGGHSDRSLCYVSVEVNLIIINQFLFILRKQKKKKKVLRPVYTCVSALRWRKVSTASVPLSAYTCTIARVGKNRRAHLHQSAHSYFTKLELWCMSGAERASIVSNQQEQIIKWNCDLDRCHIHRNQHKKGNNHVTAVFFSCLDGVGTW